LNRAELHKGIWVTLTQKPTLGDHLLRQSSEQDLQNNTITNRIESGSNRVRGEAGTCCWFVCLNSSLGVQRTLECFQVGQLASLAKPRPCWRPHLDVHANAEISQSCTRFWRLSSSKCTISRFKRASSSETSVFWKHSFSSIPQS